MTTLDAVNVQLLDGPLAQVMSNVNGVLVRQKMDVLEVCCPACERRNRYKVNQLQNGFPTDHWDDKQFWSSPEVFNVQEESECLTRCCCGGHRALKLHINTPTDVPVLLIDRPFKCTLFCCCCLLNPQELSVQDPNGKHMGQAVQDFKCSDVWCCKRHVKLMDKNGETRYYIEDNTCCNSNCCAPSCCCPVHKMPILNPAKEEIPGSVLSNVWPGCNCRGVAGGATNDNYRFEFPPDATAADKALLLGGLFLVEYMWYERRNKDDNAASDAM